MIRLTEQQLLFSLKTIVVVFLTVYIGQMAWGLQTAPGLYDAYGKPVGTDFLGFYSAGRLALSGNAAAAYDLARMHALEKTIIGPETPALPWFYPPTFLLLVTPLALLPYLLALAAWVLLTLAVFLAVVRRIAPEAATTWLTLAFPGAYENIIHSQNGFLSAALLGGGLLLVDRAPVTGGILLGLLSYKPQLAVLVPVALIAGRRWRALGAALASGAALILATLPCFGLQTWQAFWANLPLAGEMIRQGYAPHFKMPTMFVGTLLAGGGYPLAYALQGLASLGAAVVVAWVWSRQSSLAWRASALSLGVLLASPYAFEYDLAILALPLAWLAWEGRVQGWLTGERSLLVIGWLMPVAAPLLARYTHVQTAPLVLVGLLFLVWRRTYPREAATP